MFRFTSTPFQVRGYECDLYGHVNNAVYLRYLQEAGLSWLLAVAQRSNLTLDPYTAFHKQWWTGRIDIEYLQQLRYGDVIEISTWPVGARHEKLTLAFELINGGEKAAQGQYEIIYQGFTGSVERLPAALIETSFPDGMSAKQGEIEPLPQPPPPPPGIFKVRRCISWPEVNASQQLDPANLLAYIEDCGREVVAAHHWPFERMLTENIAILLRKNQLEYYHPARLGDELELSTWASDIKRVTAVRHYEARRLSDGILLARVRALGVWVDLAANRPTRMSDEMLADFSPNISQ